MSILIKRDLLIILLALLCVQETKNKRAPLGIDVGRTIQVNPLRLSGVPISSYYSTVLTYV